MTIDEARGLFGFRSEIPDDNVTLGLEAIEYGWLLRPEIPLHDIVLDRVNRQRDESAPPPDDAEITALLQAVQEHDLAMEQLVGIALDDSDTSSQNDMEAMPVTCEVVSADTVGPVGEDTSVIPPMFGPASSNPAPLPVTRKSRILSRVLGLTLILVVIAMVAYSIGSTFSKAPVVKESVEPAPVQSVQSGTQSTGQKDEPQKPSGSEAKQKPTKQLSWEKSRERMLARIRNRHGER